MEPTGGTPAAALAFSPRGSRSLTLEAIITKFGYYALFGGTFLEGESFTLIAGFCAHRGYLHIGAVVLVAFLGAFLSDQLWFHIGRARGRKILLRRPTWNARAHRLKPFLHRHKIAVLLGFRFVLGFRVVTPVILGSLGFSPWKFAAFDLVGAAAWAVIFALAGYTFGTAVEAVIGKIQHYESWILAALVLIGVAAWFIRRRRARATPSVVAAPATRAESAVPGTPDLSADHQAAGTAG